MQQDKSYLLTLAAQAASRKEGVESGEDDMDSEDAGQDKGQEHNAAENGRMVSGLVGVINRSGVWNVCCFWLLFPERLLHVLRHG